MNRRELIKLAGALILPVPQVVEGAREVVTPDRPPLSDPETAYSQGYWDPLLQGLYAWIDTCRHWMKNYPTEPPLEIPLPVDIYYQTICKLSANDRLHVITDDNQWCVCGARIVPYFPKGSPMHEIAPALGAWAAANGGRVHVAWWEPPGVALRAEDWSQEHCVPHVVTIIHGYY